MMRWILSIVCCCLPIIAAASPCDKTTIEIFNQTNVAFRLIDKDTYGRTLINNMAVNEKIRPYQMQELRVYSGIGTMGSASGVLTFIANDDHVSFNDVKFIAIDIQLHNRLLSCSVDVNVRNANYNQFEAYVLPGYHHNMKVFIVG